METYLVAGAAVAMAVALAWNRELRWLAAMIADSFREPTTWTVTERNGRRWCDGDRAGAWRYLAWLGLTRQLDVPVWRCGRPETLTTMEGAYRPSRVTTYRFLGVGISRSVVSRELVYSSPRAGSSRVVCSRLGGSLLVDPGDRCNLCNVLKANGLEWWTRTQRLRTLAELPFEAEFRVSVPIPVYQRIAAQAANMRGAGAAFHAIAERFGVDDHTAAKAVRWFRGEL